MGLRSNRDGHFHNKNGEAPNEGVRDWFRTKRKA